MFSSLQDIVFQIFVSLINNIIKPLTGLKSLSDLVFGHGLVYLTFSQSEWNNVVAPGVSVTITFAYWAILISFIYMSLMLSKSGVNPATRISLMEMLGALFFVNLLIHNLDTLFSVLFTADKVLVGLFETHMKQGDLAFKKATNGIGDLFIWCAYIGLSIWANIYYLMREFTLMLLIILSPVFISCFLFQPLRPITGTWFRELFSTIIVQAVHACIIWMFMSFDQNVTGNWLVKLVLLGSFIPLAEGVKALFGLQAGMTGKMAGAAMATGASGLAAVFSAGQAALGRSSVVDGVADRFTGGGRNRETVGSGGSSSSSNSNIGKSTPVSTNTSKMLRFGKLAGNAGKAVGTLMGAATGLPFGAAGVLGGAALGGKAGEATGGLVGRTAKGTMDMAVNKVKDMQAAINHEMDQLDTKYGLNPVDEFGGGYPLGKYRSMAAATAVGAFKGATKVPREFRMLGRVGKAGYKGAKNGFALESLDSSTSGSTRFTGSIGSTRPLTRVKSAAVGAMQGIKNEVQNMVQESGGYAEATRSIVQGAGYVGGMVAGETGVKAASTIAQNIPPVRQLRRQVQQRGMEYSDLINPNSQIKHVRMAITNEHSSLLGTFGEGEQATERRISDYRGGDRSLKPGQVVYKDYHIQEGRLAEGAHAWDQKPSFYTEDSQGGKIQTDKQYNANPYDYFEDRNTGSEKYFKPERFKQGIV
jgi:hypothetical protein